MDTKILDLIRKISPQDRAKYLRLIGMQSEIKAKLKSFEELIDNTETLRVNLLGGSGPTHDLLLFDDNFLEFVLLTGEFEYIRRFELQHEISSFEDLMQEGIELIQTSEYYERSIMNLYSFHENCASEMREQNRIRNMKLAENIFSDRK